MAYLTTTDYYGFISIAIQPDRGKINLYFESLYKEHQQDNTTDFFDRLKEVILDLKNQFEVQKDRYIKDKEEMKEMQKGLIARGTNFAKPTIDSFQNLDWNKIHFYYNNGKIRIAEIRNSVTIYEFDIRNLLRGIEEFDSYLKSNSNQEIQKNNNIKLNWVLQKNQLYYVFRQLKNEHNAISMSYDDIAQFIKENVVGFETTKKGTIEKELKKDLNDTLNFPKIKRIKVKIDKE